MKILVKEKQMGLFTKECESVQSIKALNNELERLHLILGAGDGKVNGEIFCRIKKLEDTLIEISRRHNGLEY